MSQKEHLCGGFSEGNNIPEVQVLADRHLADINK